MAEPVSAAAPAVPTKKSSSKKPKKEVKKVIAANPSTKGKVITE